MKDADQGSFADLDGTGLRIARMQVLSSPRRMPSMAGYGLEVAGFVPPKD